MTKLNIRTLEHLEEEIFDNMRFIRICKYHGDVDTKDCLREAVHSKLQLSDDAFYKLYGLHLEDYVNYLYTKVEEL